MSERAQIQALRDERFKLAEQAREIVRAADAENRELTAEEDQKHGRIHADIASLKKDIDRRERDLEVAADFEPAGRQVDPDPIQAIAGVAAEHGFEKLTPAAQRYVEKFGFSVEAAGGVAQLQETFEQLADAGNPWSEQEALAATPEYQDTYWRAIAAPGRLDADDKALIHQVNPKAALQSDNDVEGGYLVAPVQMAAGIIQELDKQISLRQKFTNFTVRGADSLGVRKRTQKASSYTRGSELGPPTPDTSLRFGRKELTPSYWTSEIVLSRDLIRRSVISIQDYANAELVRDIREQKNLEYVGADGAQKPLGIFTASEDGISTARDFTSAENPAAGLSHKGLIDAKYALYRYWNSGLEWGFHPDWHKFIAKIFDSDGRPIWQESVRVGEPDRLHGLPVFMDEDFPNTVATGQYAGALADWSNYWTATALDMESMVLREVYARTNQIGLLMRGKDDGMPILEEPFLRLELS